MYRILETFILIFFFKVVLIGQVGQTAVDFTETDINGVEHNLYSYLNDGKVVVVDAFTTTCGPCLAIHQSKLLEHLHDILGPDALDKVVVLGFEMDINSEDDALYGIGDNTFGDFATDTPYPIFNPSEISTELYDSFVDNSFPSLNIFCPDSKELVYQGINNYYGLLNSINSCGTLPEFSDLVTTKYLNPDKECASFEPGFYVLNGGTAQVDNLVLNLLQDDVVVFANANYGPIAGGQLRALKFGEYEINGDGSDFTVEVVSQDDNAANNIFNTYVGKAEALTNEVTLHVETEFYYTPLQGIITWKIQDPEGNVVHQANLDIDQTYDIDLALDADECYSFIVDGNIPTNFLKVAELRDQNQKVLPLESALTIGRVNFTSDFDTSLNGLNSDIDFRIYPSPVEDILLLKIDGGFEEDIQLQINQLNGAKVYSEKIDLLKEENELSFDVSNFKAGIYFVQLRSKKDTKTIKFIKI